MSLSRKPKPSQETPFPIDVVYTWVDGSDPHHQELLAELKGKNKEYCRFVTNNELYYSLYSLYKFAPWVRKIFIVTADYQRPNVEGLPQSVLDKITFVKHSHIMPQTSLPTFNSMAIESRLCYIQELAEQFIYFNDDVFLGNFVSPNDFFDAHGRPYFFQKKRPVCHFKPLQLLYPYSEVFQSTTKIYKLLTNKKFIVTSWRGVHQSFPSLKSILLDFWEHDRVKNVMQDLLHSKLRTYRHPNIFYLMNLVGSHSGKMQARTLALTSHFFYNLKDYDFLFRSRLYLLKLRRPPFFCINNDLKWTKNTHSEQVLRSFLYDYFDQLIPPSSTQLPVV